VVWGVVAVLLVVLWVRSFRGERHVSVFGHWIVSSYGEIFVDIYFPAPATGTEGLGPGFSVSYWIPVAIVSLLALITVPWNALSKRFTLRTLLIATTLVAIGLGLIVAVI